MSELKNRERPAFPITEEETDRIIDGVTIYSGLTKREYFAAQALKGLCSGRTEYEALHVDVTMAIALADEILIKLDEL